VSSAKSCMHPTPSTCGNEYLLILNLTSLNEFIQSPSNLASSTELHTPDLVKCCACFCCCSWPHDVNCISPNQINAHFSPVDCCNIEPTTQLISCLFVFVFATSNHSGGSWLNLCNSRSSLSLNHHHHLIIIILRRGGGRD
jgi:hypothetical protein